MTETRPRIAIYSNSPASTSGYGVSTLHLTEGLVKRGYEVAVLCNHGYQGMPIFIDLRDPVTDEPLGTGGFTLFPHDGYGLGEAGAVKIAQSWKADVVIGNYDHWVLKSMARDLARVQIPYAPWAMYDWDTDIDEGLWKNIIDATLVVPYTKYAHKHLSAHLDRVHEHIYLGVDPEVFRPIIGDTLPDGGVITKELMRSKRGFDGGRDDIHITLINKMNKGHRPNLPGMIEAWKIFADNNPDIRPRLYMHTNIRQADGYPLDKVIRQLGIPDSHVRYTTPFEIGLGLTSEQVSALYNSADVLLNATLTEGFGLPIVEALACGIPVVATDAMCMREHLEPVCPELLVAPLGRFYHTAPGKYYIPDPHGTANALEASLKRDPEKDRRKLSRYAHEKYAWEGIIDEWENAIMRTLEVADEICLRQPKPSDQLIERSAPEVIEVR